MLESWRWVLMFSVFEASVAAEPRCPEGTARDGVVCPNEWREVRASKICRGRCTVGSPETEEGRDSNERLHQISPPAPFWLLRTEVTQAQWEGVLARAARLGLTTVRVPANPSHHKGDQHPVEQVSWCDAARFANLWTLVEAKRSGRTELRPVYTTKEEDVALTGCGEDQLVTWHRDRSGFRLPTEYEWEIAARAGTATRFASGDTEADLAKVGWYKGNSRSKPKDVAQLAPNAIGLHDLHGGVWEWTWSVYSGEDPGNPGASRVVRGGSFGFTARFARSAFRGRYHPGVRASLLGFRLVQSFTPPP